MPKRTIATHRDAVLNWMLLITWATLIFTLSHQSQLPGPPQPLYDLIFKKGAHLTVYAIFYWLARRALTSTFPNNKKVWLYALLLTIGFACTDEYHQSFIPGRTPTIRDVFIDTIGALLSLGLWEHLEKKQSV